ncbi:MAG TPA: BON domain-containing protein [Candidatus Babeliaceae bacterium]|nr:BON domain-containing protein [Candidatus Babeliaceae bacterium]
MKSDDQIQKDVMDQLKWEPFLKASEVGVAVRNGIVTLSGQVDSYYKKLSAEAAAKKVSGVKAIAEDIQIGVSPLYARTDTEIAEAILNALKWHTAVQDEKVKIRVENGHVTLQGEVDWDFQRTNVRKAIESLAGVKSITSLITVKPKVTSAGIQQKIESAFQRAASINSRKIKVDVIGSKVILSGRVASLAEKEDAETSVWNADGVMQVENNLDIEIPEYSEYVDF